MNSVRLLIKWLINAVSLVIVSYLVKGFEVHGFMAALIAAIDYRLRELHARVWCSRS